MSELTKEFFLKTLDEKLEEKLEKKLDGLVTKEFFEEKLKDLATKDDLLNFPSRTEFKSLQDDVKEIKDTVTRIDKRDLLDSNAFASDILKINRRLAKLEKTKQDKQPVK